MFRLAGPDRTTRSISGGLLGAKDYGAPLISAGNAIIPAGAEPGDYILVVRVAGDPAAGWSASNALRVTYEWNGKQFDSTWRRSVTYCSYVSMGRDFCSRLD